MLVSRGLQAVDVELRQRLTKLAHRDPCHWDFTLHSRKESSHSYFQYPAMMVPSMQRQLLDVACTLQPQVRRVLEPFAGSGTVLIEAMFRGLDVRAHDINPLAILLCKAKACLAPADELEDAKAALLARVAADGSSKISASFNGLWKWFRRDAAIALSRLRRAIGGEANLRIRRFFWVALAETIRNTSNSRTSTYKLHIRPCAEILSLPSPYAVFREVLEHNLRAQKALRSDLAKLGLVTGDRYKGRLDLRLRDSRLLTAQEHDILLTSPPYGDNTSTVPYGQAAYLPLQWIDLEDIDTGANVGFLRSTYEIDSRSLGGRRDRCDYSERYGDLLSRSSTLVRLSAQLASSPADRLSRVLAFLHDLDDSAAATFAAMRENAYCFWTVGNRRVGGVEIPLHNIIPELFSLHRAKLVHHFRRRIPTKRMPTRNSFAETMRTERVLIFRRETGFVR